MGEMMLDYNHQAQFHERFTALMDGALQTEHARQEKRHYLGASRLGLCCERQLQYEFAEAPVDPGREYSGQLLRIFERGHRIEDVMAGWLTAAGFHLKTIGRDGQQFGFSVADGRLQGHVDGVLVAGPDLLTYPCLWETKCLNAKSWRDVQKRGLTVAKPIYAAQIATYQAYLELHEQPALFTAINADSMEIYAELVPFDAALAQRMSDRAVKIISATESGELLPRSFTDSTHYECKFCQWSERCWRN